MRRLALILFVVSLTLGAERASADSDQSGFEEVICVLFDALCSGGSTAPGTGNDLVLGPDESGLLEELGEGETCCKGSDGFAEFPGLPSGDGSTVGALHPTPEPSAALLFAAGLGIVGSGLRRRRAR